MEELERELGVWKAALKTADAEKKTLSKQIIRLERNIGSLRVSHFQTVDHVNYIVALIDIEFG